MKELEALKFLNTRLKAWLPKFSSTIVVFVKID